MRVLALLVLAAALSLPRPGGASAQMLPSGTWAGTLTTADGRSPTPATAAIDRCATGIDLALTVAGRTARTETGRYGRGQLAFDLPPMRLPGQRRAGEVRCTLQMDARGHLGGTCVSGRDRYRLVLAPPGDGSLGCS